MHGRSDTLVTPAMLIKKVPVHIRWMIRRDMRDVLRIESEAFDFSWSEDDFVHHLRQRNCIGQVADLGDVVGGFMVYELNKRWISLENLAVDRAKRQQGIATRLVETLIKKLSVQRRSAIVADVGEHNDAAIALFARLGFRAERVVRKKWSSWSDDDAYRFVYRIGEKLNERDDSGSL